VSCEVSEGRRKSWSQNFDRVAGKERSRGRKSKRVEVEENRLMRGITQLFVVCSRQNHGSSRVLAVLQSAKII
jgi:hypothetical protein